MESDANKDQNKLNRGPTDMSASETTNAARCKYKEALLSETREELQKAAAEGDAEAAQILADDPLGEAPAEGLGQARLPFGPFLILAMLELLFFGERIERLYRGFLGVG